MSGHTDLCIHFFICVFLTPPAQDSIEWIYHDLFHWSLINEHLCCLKLASTHTVIINDPHTYVILHVTEGIVVLKKNMNLLLILKIGRFNV